MALPKPAFRRDEPDPIESQSIDFDAVVDRARKGERVVVRGDDALPVAAVVPISDLRRLEADDIRRERAMAAIREVGHAFAHLDLEDIEREAVKAVREARAEIHAERFGTGE